MEKYLLKTFASSYADLLLHDLVKQYRVPAPGAAVPAEGERPPEPSLEEAVEHRDHYLAQLPAKDRAALAALFTASKAADLVRSLGARQGGVWGGRVFGAVRGRVGEMG